MKTRKKIVPPQRSGMATGAKKKVDAPTRHEAILLFNLAKKRLMDINNWHHLCGAGSAIFNLADPKGNLLKKSSPETGDLIRIELPGSPDTSSSDYDWVRIEKIEDEKFFLKDEEISGFRVRPIGNPANNGNESTHFYTSDATSTFMLIRNANTVTAMENGRNEKPNFSPSSLLNSLRNGIVAVSAIFGLSTNQWKKLVNGVINGPER